MGPVSRIARCRSVGTSNDLPNLLPTWAGWHTLILEDARGSDTGSNARDTLSDGTRHTERRSASYLP
jgi:hypothetical protein